MAVPNTPSWLVKGSRCEQLRVRPALRDGQPVVRLDVLEPIAAHTAAMTVVGCPVCVPPSEVDALCNALKAAQAEAATDSDKGAAR